MAVLFTKPQFYRRPSNYYASAELASALSGATTPPSQNELQFPLTEAGTVKLAAAINELDTSGQPALTAKELRDPWSRATSARLQAVVLP